MHECFIVSTILLRFNSSLLKASSLSENGDSRLDVTSEAHTSLFAEFHTGTELVLLITASGLELGKKCGIDREIPQCDLCPSCP